MQFFHFSDAARRLLLIGLAAAAFLLRDLPAAASAIMLSRTAVPPKIDGVIDDAAWAGAAKIEELYQRDPDLGAAVTERTLVYITFDRNYIYFGFRCHESSPDAITAKELARDADLSQDDRVQIILDTFLDRRNAYWFQIGPRGSIGDGLVSENGARFNKQWDDLWEGKATIHSEGWDAEVAIPFKTLSFRPGQPTWGLKLIRHLKRKEETAYWPMANRDTYRFQVSDCGTIEGLEGITQGVGLDIRPYGLVGFDHFASRRDEWVFDGGGDLFHQLTPGLKGALTVNTDFAETEVDTRLVNLTRFPLFLPEKRDFFLDGSNYFSFGTGRNDLIPFFSRRLGLDRSGQPVPILWGAKLTGQQGQWNLGLLGLMDDFDGDKRLFSVARVTRNLGRQSSVGAVFTSGNGLTSAENRLVGGDFRLASSSFRGNQNVALTVFGLKSFTAGTRGDDSALGAQFDYPNDLLNLQGGYQQIGRNFQAGVGFVRRVDIRQSYLKFELGPRPERWRMRQLKSGAGIDYLTDFGGALLTRQIEYAPLALLFDSGDSLKTALTSEYEFLETDFQIHPDYRIPAGTYRFHWYSASLESAKRRNLWLSLEARWGAFFNGRRRGTTASLGYKVVVPLYLGVEYQRDRVHLPEGDFTVNISRFNANVLFSPDLTLYNFVQYDNLTRRLGWQSRFYWILKPGNEIILVWNSTIQDPFEHGQLSEGSARFKVNYNFRF